MREDRLIAYHALSGFQAKRILVFAPHPDDEIFGCGGALALAVQAKSEIRVIVVTDGAQGEQHEEDGEPLATRREQESRMAADVIGYQELHFWRLPDRSLCYEASLIERIKQATLGFAPDLVLAPSFTEVHPDHRAIAQAVLSVAEATQASFDIAFYEVGQPLRPNCLLDIGSVYALKRQGMHCFSSQLSQRPYARVIEALNTYRTYTLDASISHAEAFFYLSRNQITSGLHDVWRWLASTDSRADPLVGEAGLAVSVIVPTSSPERLFQVLASQTYRALEWIPLGDLSMIPRSWQAFFPRFADTERCDDFDDVLDVVQSDWVLICSGQRGFSSSHIEQLVDGLHAHGKDRLELFGLRQSGEDHVACESFLIHRSLFERLRRVEAKRSDRLNSAQRGVDWLASDDLPALLFKLSEQTIAEPVRLFIEQPDLVAPSPAWLYDIRVPFVEDREGAPACFELEKSTHEQRLFEAHQKLDATLSLLRDERLSLEAKSMELRGMQWTIDHRASEVGLLEATIAEQSIVIDHAKAKEQDDRWTIDHLRSDLEQVKAEAAALFEAKQAAIDGARRDVEDARRVTDEARQEADEARQAAARAQIRATALEEQGDRLLAENRLLHESNEEASLHLARSYAFIAHLEQDLLVLKEALNRREADLRAVQEDAREQFAKVLDLAQTLHRIHGSRAWRMIQRYRGLRRYAQARFSLAALRDLLREKVWPRLPASLKQALRPYIHLMRGALWVPNSSQNLPALQVLSEERLNWLGQGYLSLTSLMRQVALSDLQVDGQPALSVDMQLILYQSEPWIKAWVASLFAQTFPLHRLNLIVVDHRPGDGSASALHKAIDDAQAKTGKQLRSLRLIEQANRGFAAGHNRAFKAGESPWVMVVNPDLEFEAECLTNMVSLALADDAKVASWECRQKPYEHPKHYDPVSGYCNWSSHACVLLRRSAIEAIGGWDERLFMYCEDVAMSYRLREAGYLLRYCPSAVVWHHSYGDPTEVKQSQYIGSAVGLVYLRLRYGTWQDAWAAGAILAHRWLTAPTEWRGEIRQKGLAMLARAFSLRRERLRFQPPQPVFFPFRGLDYELRRDGALIAFKSLAQSDERLRSSALVSIITRTYGGEDGRQRLGLLRQAAACVALQTWPHLEWLVVEDGASLESPTAQFVEAFAKAHEHLKVRYVASAAVGRSLAGNRALEATSGQWIGFLDDDDLLYADHVETLMQAISASLSEEAEQGKSKLDTDRIPRLVAAYARAFDVPSQIKRSDAGAVSGTVPRADGPKQSARAEPLGLRIEEDEPFMHEGHDRSFDAQILLSFNYMPIQSVLFHRRLYEERGGFDPELEHLEDWNLWVRYAQGNRFAYIPKTTSLYRTPKDPAEKERRQRLLDAAYEPVREKNHIFCQSLRQATKTPEFG